MNRSEELCILITWKQEELRKVTVQLEQEIETLTNELQEYNLGLKQ